MTLYPVGYGSESVTLAELRRRHEPRMHPEYARRLFAYIEHKRGALGIGSGWRTTPHPVSPASMRGESFHQDQRFASGFVGYAAVDLVAPDGPDGNNAHDGVSWAATADAPLFGLHTFIMSPPEPWHIQCVEMRGWGSWVNAGRPDPQRFALPGTPAPAPPPPPPIPQGADNMRPIQPVRVSNTRVWPGPIGPGDAVFGLPDNFPANVVAVALNVVVLDADADGYCTIWPAGAARPDTSCVNYKRAEAANGSIVVGVRDRRFGVFLSSRANVIVDVTGYWLPT